MRPVRCGTALRAAVFTFLGSIALFNQSPVRAQDALTLQDGPTQDAATQGLSDFSLSMGYANISLGSNSAIDREGAFRFEPSLTIAPIAQLPQLRVGGDVGVTLVLDNSSRTIISGDNGLVFVGSSDIPIWFIEPELRVSWRQYLGKDQQFFIEPGVAGGVAFGFLDLTGAEGYTGDYNSDDSTLYGRVFLRAGAQVSGGLAGFEASWLQGGDLDFGGNASGSFNEFYIGFFGSLCF